MRKVTVNELLAGTGGVLALGQETQSFSGIGTDTRKDLTGQVFWALKGESFDAHDFLEKAIQQGATGLVLNSDSYEKQKHQIQIAIQTDSKSQASTQAQAQAQTQTQTQTQKRRDLTIVTVSDTLQALQSFASYVRSKNNWNVVGVTGSNGKTTSKEFIQVVLGQHVKVHSNKGSFNNHFGLPFNLLATPEGVTTVVAEMGMNHAGELQHLCAIAKPNTVVCTMVGRGHIEHFGSVEKIASAKEEIYKFSPPESTRIYNLDNPWTYEMWRKDQAGVYGGSHRVLTMSAKNKNADVYLTLKSLAVDSITIEGRIGQVTSQARVPIFGAHNVLNLQVAAAVGLACGMNPESIWGALPLCHSAWGRNQFIKTKIGAEILFDAYNANPDSMGALLDNLEKLKLKGRKIGFFAEMLELGEHAGAAHRELGEKVGRSGFDVVAFYGPHAGDFEAGLGAAGFQNKQVISDRYEDSLASAVVSMLKMGDLVLVKGSRGMKMERFVQLCQPLNFESK